MTREEAIAILQEEIDGNLELTLREWRERDEQRLFPALRMAIESLSQPNYETDTEVRLVVTNRKKEKVILWDAYGEVEYYPIEALSAKQKEEDLAKDIARRMATIIENEQDMRVILKSTEPTDLISRADALKPFCIAPDGTRIPEVDCDNFPVEFSVEFIKKHLMSLPSAEQKTGEWIENVVRWGNTITTVHGYKCSECGELNLCKDKFCPNCGIRMRMKGNK